MAFDDCSGDYWVLDALGHHVVQRLLEDGALPALRLQSEVGQIPELAGDVGELEPVLARLLDAGLIQPAHLCAG